MTTTIDPTSAGDYLEALADRARGIAKDWCLANPGADPYGDEYDGDALNDKISGLAGGFDDARLQSLATDSRLWALDNWGADSVREAVIHAIEAFLIAAADAERERVAASQQAITPLSLSDWRNRRARRAV